MAGSSLNREKRRLVGGVLRFTLATSFHVQSELFRLAAMNDVWTSKEHKYLVDRHKLLDRINSDLVKLADRTKL